MDVVFIAGVSAPGRRGHWSGEPACQGRAPASRRMDRRSRGIRGCSPARDPDSGESRGGGRNRASSWIADRHARPGCDHLRGTRKRRRSAAAAGACMDRCFRGVRSVADRLGGDPTAIRRGVATGHRAGPSRLDLHECRPRGLRDSSCAHRRSTVAARSEPLRAGPDPGA